MSAPSQYLAKADEFIKTFTWKPETESEKLIQSVVVGNIYGFAGYLERHPFTEASTQEALAILDDAQANAGTLTDAQLLQMIDVAAQKLRGVRLSEEDAELVELAKRHPIDLPWMQAEAAEEDLSNVSSDELRRRAFAISAEFGRRPRDYSRPAVLAIATPMCSGTDCQQCQKIKQQ